MPLLSIPRKLVIATEIIVSDLKDTFFLCRKLSNNKSHWLYFLIFIVS